MLKNKMRTVRQVKMAMKEIWEQSRLFRIADAVHMAEIYILQRLCSDGVFPWLQLVEQDYYHLLQQEQRETNKKPVARFQQMHACFYMRRYVDSLVYLQSNIVDMQ